MTRLIPLLLLAATLLFAAAPFVTPGFGGFTPDQYPVPQVDPPVQPAGWAFSIWGVIYLWLIASAGYGLLRRADSADWARARPWLLASLAPGIAWLWVALQSPVWAAVLIWWMTLTALGAVKRAGHEDRWWQREAYGIYAGWLTAAACVSLGLLGAGWGLAGQTVAAVAAILFALAIALIVQRARPDILSYPLAVIWALAGIVAQNVTLGNLPVMALAALGIVLLAARIALRATPRAA